VSTFRAHGCEFLIWSFEHGSWWLPNESGYTHSIEKAGAYSLERAVEICAHANHRPPTPAGTTRCIEEAIVPIPRRRG
jgi:hypothetical protein